MLTSDPAAGVPAENAAQDETDGTFSADVLTPARIQASFFWSREDAARMAGMGDALQEALQGGIADKLDSEIMQGTNGLLTGTNRSNHARSSASNYNHYVENLMYARVDGRYAADLADIRVVWVRTRSPTLRPSSPRTVKKTRWPASATTRRVSV